MKPRKPLFQRRARAGATGATTAHGQNSDWARASDVETTLEKGSNIRQQWLMRSAQGKRLDAPDRSANRRQSGLDGPRSVGLCRMEKHRFLNQTGPGLLRAHPNRTGWIGCIGCGAEGG
jgi:hypothetical protein